MDGSRLQPGAFSVAAHGRALIADFRVGPIQWIPLDPGHPGTGGNQGWAGRSVSAACSFGLDGTAVGLVIGLPIIRVDLGWVVSRHEGPLHLALTTPAGQIRIEDPQRLGDVDLVDGVLPGGWRGLTIVEDMFDY